MPCATHTFRVWAGELIRHSNQQSHQSRDTATFLEVFVARWVRALGITEGKGYFLLYAREVLEKALYLKI
jgi:hypothetical protein